METYEDRQIQRLQEQRALEAEASMILKQAGIHHSGRRPVEMPKNYWLQSRFERRIQVNAAYAGKGQR